MSPQEAAHELLKRATIGALVRVDGPIIVVPYDPTWPQTFAALAERIQAALGPVARRVEHVGSTSVPGLAAKPIIDILLLVADSAGEAAYVPALEAAGYVLRIREPDWHEHRLLKRPDEAPGVNLHVFSDGSDEPVRMLRFRDWLRTTPADLDLYSRTKQELAAQTWAYVQDYADAKTEVVQAIMARALADLPADPP